MKIKHNFETGKTVIELSWIETRQFISTSIARETVGNHVSNLVSSPISGGETTRSRLQPLQS
jgi:hypothetical protein